MLHTWRHCNEIQAAFPLNRKQAKMSGAELYKVLGLFLRFWSQVTMIVSAFVSDRLHNSANAACATVICVSSGIFVCLHVRERDAYIKKIPKRITRYNCSTVLCKLWFCVYPNAIERAQWVNVWYVVIQADWFLIVEYCVLNIFSRGYMILMFILLLLFKIL